MTTEKKFYRSNYCTGNNCKFEHVLKANGKIDFEQPPEGYRYTATPIEKDMIKDWDLDPMFVTTHKFGAKESLSYMELTEISISKAIEQPHKAASNREQRYSRCRIISEKTGREIMCPYDGAHSCAGCEKAGELDNQNSKPLYLDALFVNADGEAGTFDVPSPENIEADFEEKDTRECIRRELKKLDAISLSKNRRGMNLQVYDLWVEGFTSSEISELLGIKKATLHDDLVRIGKIIKKYID